MTKRAMVKKAMVWMVALMLAASAHELRGQGNAQTAAQPREPGKLVGNWQGTLQIGNGQRVLIKMTNEGAQGAPYKGTLYLIDSGGQAVGVPAITASGTDVGFAIAPMRASYTGTLNPDGSSITGSMKMADGSTHALNLSHVNDENTWAIPEPPKPMAANANPKFNVVTVKPAQPNSPGAPKIGFQGQHFRAQNFSVDALIALAYGLHPQQISGAPEWCGSELFDIDGIPDVPGVPSLKQTEMMIQGLLTDRFQLKFHHEQRELSVFVITVAKGGPKMTVSAAGPDDPQGFGLRGLGDIVVRNMTMADFAKWMQGSVLDRPVVDQTGLKDRYDFTLKWTPDDSQFAQFRSAGARPSTKSDPNAPPALNDAAQQQIGLRIEPMKAQDDVMVIDHAKKPAAN